MTVARELHDTQCDLPFMLCSGMHAALKPSIAVELCSAGEVELLCAPGQRERVYTLARYAGLPLSHPVHEAHVVAKVKQVQAQRAATHAATGQQQREEAAAGGSTAAAPPASPSAAAAPVPEPATASARCATAEAPQLLGPAFPSKPSGPPGDKGGREPGSGDAPQPQPVFKQPKLGASMGGSRHAALAPFRAATLHKGCNHSLPRNTGRCGGGASSARGGRGAGACNLDAMPPWHELPCRAWGRSASCRCALPPPRRRLRLFPHPSLLSPSSKLAPAPSPAWRATC